MKKLVALALTSTLVISSVCFADDSNRCGELRIQLSNLTKSACILTSEKVIHGLVIQAAPTSIMPNESKTFLMEQTGFGPSIMLSYQCGEENITFTSQQNVCVISAGKIKGEVLQPHPTTFNGTYTVQTGSAFWSKPGNISWRFSSR